MNKAEDQGMDSDLFFRVEYDPSRLPKGRGVRERMALQVRSIIRMECLVGHLSSRISERDKEINVLHRMHQECREIVSDIEKSAPELGDNVDFQRLLLFMGVHDES